MVQTLAVTKAMTSLSQAHQLLELSPASDPHFFTDWFEDLPALSDQEKTLLDRYRDRKQRQYSLSRKFTLSNLQRNELWDVASIIKQIKRTMALGMGGNSVSRP